VFRRAQSTVRESWKNCGAPHEEPLDGVGTGGSVCGDGGDGVELAIFSNFFYPVWILLDKLEIGQPIAWANVVTRMITLIYDAVGLETNQDKALFK